MTVAVRLYVLVILWHPDLYIKIKVCYQCIYVDCRRIMSEYKYIAYFVGYFH